MKLGIMQPYFVPYIGYWQLMNAVDRYVIYDDVNYINRGWVNRNRILSDNGSRYFNVQMSGASQNKLINEIRVNNGPKEKARNLNVIRDTYKKAPFFKEIFPLVTEIIEYDDDNLAGYLFYSIEKIKNYLGIKTELLKSSDIEKDNTLKGQDKILSICTLLGASDYYNAIGGMKLYVQTDFQNKGINLYFIKTKDIIYQQFGNEFQSNLSIIDVMMFNSREEIKGMLNEYELIRGG